MMMRHDTAMRPMTLPFPHESMTGPMSWPHELFYFSIIKNSVNLPFFLKKVTLDTGKRCQDTVLYRSLQKCFRSHQG
jgi:hypothetical protein